MTEWLQFTAFTLIISGWIGSLIVWYIRDRQEREK